MAHHRRSFFTSSALKSVLKEDFVHLLYLGTRNGAYLNPSSCLASAGVSLHVTPDPEEDEDHTSDISSTDSRLRMVDICKEREREMIARYSQWKAPPGTYLGEPREPVPDAPGGNAGEEGDEGADFAIQQQTPETTEPGLFVTVCSLSQYRYYILL